MFISNLSLLMAKRAIMTVLVYMTGVLIGLSYGLQGSRGKIYPPAGGHNLTFTSGSTAKIKWSFDVNISRENDTLVWYFQRTPIADIKKGVFRQTSHLLSGVSVEKPATLLLRNVNQSYTGKYTFGIRTPEWKASSLVCVSIKEPGKLTVTVNCSDLVTIYEGDNVACVCTNEEGITASNVTWYKDEMQIEMGEEEQTLALKNVDGSYGGIYKCVAHRDALTAETSFKIIVYQTVPPAVTSLTFSPENPVIGQTVVITCEAKAMPLPSYIIVHNESDVVSTHKTYIIAALKYRHAGSYKCITTNRFGNSSKVVSLSFNGTRMINRLTTKIPRKVSETAVSSEYYIVYISLPLSGIVVGLFLAYIVVYSRRHCHRNLTQKRHSKRHKVEDRIYEEVNLRKMNTENNYWSMGDASHATDAENEPGYADLNRVRDVENNYQSLNS